MHGLLRCNINAGVHARTRSGRVTQRCHKSPDGKRGYRVRVTSRTGSARRIWGILKKSVELSPAPGEDGWLSLAHGGLGQVSHEMGGGWKSLNRKNVYLSPYVEEPLNSKVIKSFVPELRSRKCFSCLEILCSMYIFYEHYMYVSRIAVSGYVTSLSPRKATSELPRTTEVKPLLPKRLRFIKLCYSNASNQKLWKFFGRIKIAL